MLPIQTQNTVNGSLPDVLDLSPEMKCLSFYNGNLCCEGLQLCKIRSV